MRGAGEREAGGVSESRARGNGLGAKLRALRKENEWSLREVGARVGASYNQVNLIERGDNMPGVELGWRLARLYGLTVEDLLDDSDASQAAYQRALGDVAFAEFRRELELVPVSYRGMVLDVIRAHQLARKAWRCRRGTSAGWG